MRINFKERFGICLTQMYGSTETGSLAISSNEDEANVFSKIFKGVDVLIKNDVDGIPWIYIKTPDTIGSYLKSNYSLNLLDDFIKMGDVGSVTEDNKLHVLGRGDDIIIISGKKFSIKNIYNLLKKNPDIINFNLYKNKINGELTCEYISNLAPYLIREFCRKHLPEYQIPKHFYKVNFIQSNNVNWKNNL